MVSSYLSLAELDVSEELVNNTLAKLDAHLAKESASDVRWQYQIPELGEGGACSLFGNLQDEPFLLTDYLLQDKSTTLKLEKLKSIVDYVVAETNIDWFGIYQETATDQGPQLLKLAYYGAPSRPLFPLTEAFAKISNNVHVALTGKGRIINDVPAYLSKGGEYYTCDPKVKAETCIPLFNAQQQCVGIVDGEAFTVNFFDKPKLALLIAACIRIPQFLV
ncbi:MAG: GAF domain-containing protein [Pseudoalteromonas sp.]|uniref:GAF domain-containing protein n=1 Tax=unclassified Pseudoalteromonas TaxID=194690 RepID=UPI003F9637F1